jgi:hypothetical protein
MEWPLINSRPETYEQMRDRLIAETSAYLTECLRHPEYAVRIPTIQAGKGRFPPTFASSFWDEILAE